MDSSIVEIILKPIGRLVIKSLLTPDVRGIEHIPGKGPAVVISNHESFLDSVILGFLSPRTIWFMAKNSEYRNGFMKWFLRHACSFPVRRYTVDVLAVRNAFRIAKAGHLLGIFPEGERTWDGEMLPFRIGAIRLILALGVPVIPVGIAGTYGLMPRWTSTIRRAPVRLTFGEALNLPRIPIPAQTGRDIEETSARIRAEIERLIRGGA